MILAQLIPQFIFFAFAIILVGAALMTIISRNPVRCALYLVLAFFAAASLWLLLSVEFLGLILILVYVGAVMTLFLFVVMTLNIDREVERMGFIGYLPYGVVILVMLVLLLVYAIRPEHFDAGQLNAMAYPPDYSNVKALGNVLYTDYVYPFELAGTLLLVAIIAAISLAFRGRQPNKNPPPRRQIDINRKNRIRIVQMPSEKK